MTTLIKPWFLGLIWIAFFNSHVDGRHGEDKVFASTESQGIQNSKSKLLTTTTTSTAYPLDPLSAEEIQQTAVIIRAYGPVNSRELNFDYIGLHEPPKAQLLSSFLTDTDPPFGSIDRKACALVIDFKTQEPFLFIVNLSTGQVESFTPARGNTPSPYFTSESNSLAKNISFSDPDVLKRFSDLGFNKSQITVEGWEAGYVADNPTYAQVRKLVQLFFYVVLDKNDNRYAHPVDFVAYVDLEAKVVRGIEDFPIHQGFDRTDRSGNSVPLANATIYPQFLPSNFMRKDIKPIAISRPKGVSFTINGRQVKWQNFQFRVGFNPREGGSIHHVSYNDYGNLRALFYRLSVSEVFFQYGDSRPPYHRKSSFDMGEFLFGYDLVSLSGEFCRGKPAYFDAVIHNGKAEPSTVKNAICVVEEFDDVLWAYSSNLGTTVKQSQRLAIKSYVWIGSFQYLVSWRFYLDATVELSIRVTGVVATHLAAIDIKSPPPPYGNLVAPKVYTLNFQYFMCARVDADIDGVDNTCAVEDMIPVSEEVDPLTNPYGNGMVTNSTILKTAEESRTQYESGRSWRISNPNHMNPLNGRPTSYKMTLEGPIMPSLLCLDSPIRERIPWADYNMWVLPCNDSQIYVGDTYLDGGVSTWTNDDPTANIENTDVTLWPVFGFAYAPDLEDWPIISGMPDVGIKLKPSNFFTQNPALSVPPASETTKFDDNYGNKTMTG